MSSASRVVFNGKFLSAEPTGVHRVAEELIRAVFARLRDEPDLRRRLDAELWVPEDGAARAAAVGLPFRVAGPLTGIPWEQLTLPVRAAAQGRTIVSLCNVGPMMARNAVTMFHDAQVHISPASYSRGFRWWYRLHQPVAGRRHRRILTVSAFSREQLVAHGLVQAGRVGVIHNGIDHVAHAQPDTGVLERLQLTPGAFVLGLANTQAHKNIPLLLQAWRDPRLHRTPLVLFGGADRAAFEAQGHAVPQAVRFAGRVSDAQLQALYEAALCLAFPSLTEGFGLPPLEAMAAGCPALVAPCGALPEVCGEAALAVPPHDPAAWADAVVALREDPMRRARLVDAGQAQARRFTWAAAGDRLLDELLSLDPQAATVRPAVAR